MAHGADVNAVWGGHYPIILAPLEAFAPRALKWLLDHGAASGEAFRPGLVDAGELVAMALSLIAAVRAASGIWHGLLALPSPRRRPSAQIPL